ncbi:hypothetical protein K788_0000650 [Paraburkholderia caribensis MBA4]|uniref:Uncharacterized protein n=1 Tax=Paraburkholderia caribensis MBA4 TaxID=1323664 RepID=A0A0P0RHP6_9BURK|nr:DUF6765 family protein [Paraburkholderia caribensis]ALL68249.1 hypothetical protein K788_0000650 [Paraburkholderia caribensis MBA4]
MNIDFHYGVIYVVARLAGMVPADAETVAHACQYVDDATTDGVLVFRTGETYERFASAHSMHDYQNAQNSLNRLVWAPFHFLPAGTGQTLEERAVCRPDSEVARSVVRHAIRAAGAANSLHRLGVTLHAYVDTWAHQGFSGIKSDFNRVRDIESADMTSAQWGERIKQFAGHLFAEVETDLLSEIFPLGHGAALHYPDLPWGEWSYTNTQGVRVHRRNLPEFLAAADMAYRVVRGFLSKQEQFESLPGLPDETKRALELLLLTNRSGDPDLRLETFNGSVASGQIPGLRELIPQYIAKGDGSWKHRGTGLSTVDDGDEEPVYSPEFESSDYRYFHDAVKEHRFVVTQDILPQAGLRIA